MPIGVLSVVGTILIEVIPLPLALLGLFVRCFVEALLLLFETIAAFVGPFVRVLWVWWELLEFRNNFATICLVISPVLHLLLPVFVAWIIFELLSVHVVVPPMIQGLIMLLLRLVVANVVMERYRLLSWQGETWYAVFWVLLSYWNWLFKFIFYPHLNILCRLHRRNFLHVKSSLDVRFDGSFCNFQVFRLLNFDNLFLLLVRLFGMLRTMTASLAFALDLIRVLLTWFSFNLIWYSFLLLRFITLGFDWLGFSSLVTLPILLCLLLNFSRDITRHLSHKVV